MPQGSIYWQGTQRRACAPGAHWNVQVVRGKVTTRCLWHACKALGVGLLLMLLGACMATIGYYADQLSTGQEIRGNITVKVKNESRGFHLNNLSYAGPIVMGVGGFIVVAACVMTFEARDSAAKVVPARFRFSQGSSMKYARNQRPRRSTSSQTSKWDHQLGLFRVNRTPSPSAYEISRRQMTAEFLRFSRNLQEKGVPTHLIKKSPSAPSLVMKKSPGKRKVPKFSGCALLNPELLQRHALSVDNPGYSPSRISKESLDNNKANGSQVSMAMDLYIPNKGPVTLKVKDRSDTARRHQLARQTKIEDMEEEEARRLAAKRQQQNQHAESVSYFGAHGRYPVDFASRKRASVDLRLTDEYGSTGPTSKGNSPRDFRKTSSPNFRNMSADRSTHRKSSLEFRRSPDFRRADCKYGMDDIEPRSRANTGENMRKPRNKLHHSRSDESRRRSLERHRRDSQQNSRHSLNAPVVVERCGPEYKLEYFIPTLIDQDTVPTTNTEKNHVIEIGETEVQMTGITIEKHIKNNILVEESELENMNDNQSETLGKDIISNDNIKDNVSEKLREPINIEESIINVQD